MLRSETWGLCRGHLHGVVVLAAGQIWRLAAAWSKLIPDVLLLLPPALASLVIRAQALQAYSVLLSTMPGSLSSKPYHPPVTSTITWQGSRACQQGRWKRDTQVVTRCTAVSKQGGRLTSCSSPPSKMGPMSGSGEPAAGSASSSRKSHPGGSPGGGPGMSSSGGSPITGVVPRCPSPVLPACSSPSPRCACCSGRGCCCGRAAPRLPSGCSSPELLAVAPAPPCPSVTAATASPSDAGSSPVPTAPSRPAAPLAAGLNGDTGAERCARRSLCCCGPPPLSPSAAAIDEARRAARARARSTCCYVGSPENFNILK